MVWSRSDSWMLTGDFGGYVKYWQTNMNNVKMYQAHKDPVRGLRYCCSRATLTLTLGGRIVLTVLRRDGDCTPVIVGLSCSTCRPRMLVLGSVWTYVVLCLLLLLVSRINLTLHHAIHTTTTHRSLVTGVFITGF